MAARARTAADGKSVRRIARTAADGVGAREWLEMGGEKKPLVMSELGCADGCGWEMRSTEWLEIGGEKRPLVMSELGCAEGCGRQMGGENCADGVSKENRCFRKGDQSQAHHVCPH